MKQWLYLYYAKWFVIKWQQQVQVFSTALKFKITKQHRHFINAIFQPRLQNIYEIVHVNLRFTVYIKISVGLVIVVQ